MASNSDFKKDSGTVKEEVSAFGQRVKGAVKEGVGKMTDNERLEREGRIENTMGNTRQAMNDVIDVDRRDTETAEGWRDPLYSERQTDPLGSSTLGQSFDRATGATGSTIPRSAYDTSSQDLSSTPTRTGYDSSRAGISSSTGMDSGAKLTQERTVSAVFHDRNEAEQAWHELKNRYGLKESDISVMMSDKTRKDFYGNVKPGDEFKDDDNRALEGLGVGSALGGTLGAIVGAIAAIGTNLIIPGAGLVIAGPLAAAFAGAGLGGVTGGLVGTLVGAGIPEEHAHAYEAAVRGGAVVLSVHTHDSKQAQEVESYLSRQGAQVRSY